MSIITLLVSYTQTVLHLLNEVKLQLHNATCAQHSYNSLCMLLHTLPYPILIYIINLL